MEKEMTGAAEYLASKPKTKLSEVVIHLEEKFGLKRAQISTAIISANKQKSKEVKKAEKKEGKKAADKDKDKNKKTAGESTQEDLMAKMGELMAQLAELQARLDGDAAPDTAKVDRSTSQTPPIYLSSILYLDSLTEIKHILNNMILHIATCYCYL
jgi:hypothetical protein